MSMRNPRMLSEPGDRGEIPVPFRPFRDSVLTENAAALAIT